MQDGAARSGVESMDGFSSFAFRSLDLEIKFIHQGCAGGVRTDGAVTDIAAHGAGVSYLRPTDGEQGLGKHGNISADDVIGDDFGKGGARTDENGAALVHADCFQFIKTIDVDKVAVAAFSLMQPDQHVGAAGKDFCSFIGGKMLDRVLDACGIMIIFYWKHDRSLTGVLRLENG